MAQTTKWQGNNRAIFEENRCKRYTLYRTAVVTLADGVLTLNTGGHNTATTQRAMNQALSEEGYPGRVRIRKGVWYYGDTRFNNDHTLTIVR